MSRSINQSVNPLSAALCGGCAGERCLVWRMGRLGKRCPSCEAGGRVGHQRLAGSASLCRPARLPTLSCSASCLPSPSPAQHDNPHAACDESAPTAKPGDNERTDRLLAAEAVVLEAGGCVVRLVGLYHAQRCAGLPGSRKL